MNADSALCICADIANSLKHGGLDPKFKSRSDKDPKLGKLKYEIPQETLGSIRVGAFDVGVKVSNPALVILEMPILDKKNLVIGDAFKCLDYALKAWERIIREAENVA